MIMKLNVSNELKSRLMHAAENGSVIAKDILLEVKKNVPVEEIIRGTYNCFSTKRKRTEAGTFKKIRIVFTASPSWMKSHISTFSSKGSSAYLTLNV